MLDLRPEHGNVVNTSNMIEIVYLIEIVYWLYQYCDSKVREQGYM